MEALFAGSLDLTYVGTGPALNAHFKSQGSEIRVISGAANGGAALVTKNDSIKTAEDFRGKRIATPQMGNTQDIACRAVRIHPVHCGSGRWRSRAIDGRQVACRCAR